MRLKRIKLNSNFRGLKSGFELNFLLKNPNFYEVNPYSIVGRNGSGKSNILELISLIFFQIELICLEEYIPEELIDYIEEEDAKAYELFYVTLHSDTKELKDIYVKKESGKRVNMYYSNDLEESLKKEEIKKILPEHIIAYSSGDNEILSLPFLKMQMIQYDEYKYKLINLYPYNSFPESRFIYFDDSFSQAIFLSNLIFNKQELINILPSDFFDFKIKSFRIVVNQSHFEKLSDENIKNEKINLFEHIKNLKELINHYTDTSNLNEKEKKIIEDKFVDSLSKIYDPTQQIELTSALEKNINKLKNCATSYYYNELEKKLYIDFYINSSTIKAFKLYFKDGLTLFKLLQTFIILNNYQISEDVKSNIYLTDSLYAKGKRHSISWDEMIFKFKNFWIEKNGKAILSKSLSDGEHQLLHTLGLSLLYKNTSSLFLLDEPDTNFNPTWSAKYISILKKCFEDDKQTPEILISSHSPFIVSDTKDDNVLIFEKDENGKVDCKKAVFNTFGASVDKITSKIFGQKSSMGDRSSVILEDYRNKIEKSDDLKALVKEIDEELGESIEKFLLLKNIFDRIKKEDK